MGGSAGVGAYSSPHAPSHTYHILQYIYILYTDFFGFIWFFCEIFYGIFYLSLVCRSVVGKAPTRWRYCNMYSAIYMDEGDDMMGE